MKKLWNEAVPALDMTLADESPQAELRDLLQQRDPAAYERLMRRYNRLLFRTARSILKDDAEAQDAVQEAWLSAFTALHSFRGDSKLGTWLVRIVINQALQQQRRLGRLVVWDDDALMEESAMAFTTPGITVSGAPESPEQAAARHELRRELEDAIDLLPPIYRCVFMLRAVDDLSVEETADALQVSQDVVKTRYLRARGLLRGQLDSASSASLRLVHDFQDRRCDETVRAVLAALRSAGLVRDS
jgi:RNA polymerase sigma-70 factor, ECF subfamily